MPGDLIETGVWRGGASIFMRAVLRAHGVTDRAVYVADSFEGLPPPDPTISRRRGNPAAHEGPARRSVSKRCEANFERYGLLDDHVQFVKGWFRDTLPRCATAGGR